MSNLVPHVRPMLATLVAKPFDRAGWIYEEKYDDDRVLAYKQNGAVQMLSRNGKARNDRFPAIATAVAKLPAHSLLLDGEVVVFDKNGISHFQDLQESKGKPVYTVFDCLYCDGKDLRGNPLSMRRAILQKVLHPGPDLTVARQLIGNGIEAFREAKRAGFEGLVAKDLSSPYVEARSQFWLKVKVHQEDEFLILGYTRPNGSRQHFGALLLGVYERGHLHYVGKVGTGFNRKTLATLFQQFQPLIVSSCPFVPPPTEKHIVYLRPELIAQISYQELTADRKLRQPVFLGLRDDKSVKDVTLPVVAA